MPAYFHLLFDHMVLTKGFTAAVFLLLAPVLAISQTASKSLPDSTTSVKKAVNLASNGHCVAALPALTKSLRQVSDPDLKRKAGLAGLRCAMTLGRTDTALTFLELLAHDFPHDPDVLYAEVHAYSDLSSHASQLLAQGAPTSPQAHELLAETYEMQGKWDDAEKEYRAIIAHNPGFPGIHFRLGRLLLSKPNPPASTPEDAKHEFEQELAIDPSNAGAEYVLGELARQTQSWDDAVNHFSRAAKLDPQFEEAYLGLGVSLISLKHFPDAIPPLEMAVKLDPASPDAHYQLATAYTRSGRKQDAEKEFATHQRLIKTQGGAAPAPSQPSDEKN